jgi:predicted N-formylglutamate amidohydrolase
LSTNISDRSSSQSLLTPGDPSPVTILNPRGPSPFLLIGDHAGNHIPQSLGSLGLAMEQLDRHIAWDIGVADLGKRLSHELDAVFIHQTYSRLVVDCNRHLGALDAMPAISDGTEIPANAQLSDAQRQERALSIYTPYQDAITGELARRDAAGKVSALVSLHSFTPAMSGQARPWQIGVLFSEGATDFAAAVLAALSRRKDLVVGHNEPYAMDGTDYTVPQHAFVKRRPYVELEVRQDQLLQPLERAYWSSILADALIEAADSAGIGS